MHHRFRSKHTLFQFLGLVMALSGCGSPSSTEPVVPTHAELDAELATWSARPFKACSLDEAFPSLVTEEQPAGLPEPFRGWDVRALRAAYGPNLVVRSPNEPERWVILSSFELGDLRGGSARQTRTRNVDGAWLEAKLELEEGRCHITLNGETVFDGRVYGRASVVASMTPGRTYDLPFVANEVDLKGRDFGDAERSWFALAPVVQGFHFVDFASFPLVVEAGLLPPEQSEPAALTAQVGGLLGISPSLLSRALTAGSGAVYEEVFMPDIAMPNVVSADAGPTHRAPVILDDTELAALDGATQIHFTWPYARDASPTTVSQFEITIARMAGNERKFVIQSIRYKDEYAPSPLSAAQCAAGAVERLLASIPARNGLAPGANDASGACANLGSPYIGSLAADPLLSAKVLALVTDATRTRYGSNPVGFVLPSDGGIAYASSFEHDLLVPLLSELASSEGGRAQLAALDSGIVDGFLTSVAALSAHPFGLGLRAELTSAVAERALNAAYVRYSVKEDHTALDATAVTRIAAVLGDAAPPTFVREVTEMIREGESLATNAAIACASGNNLSDVRTLVGMLESRVPEANETWVWNVYRTLMRWDDEPSEIPVGDKTYCSAAFVQWANDHVADATLPCTYMGVKFDSRDDCE